MTQQPQPVFPAPQPRRRLDRRRVVLAIVAVLLIAIVAALNLIHVPYVVMRPGPATNTLGKVDGKEVIKVEGASTYPTSGALDFTTVSMSGGPAYPLSVMDYLKAKYIDDHAAIYPESDWFPKGTTKKQVEQQSSAQMTGSQEIAEVLALRKAGFTVPEEVTVGMIDAKGTGAKFFKLDDRLISLDGAKITDLESVHTAMSKVKPGQKVSVAIVRKGTPMTLQVPTGNADGRAIFGIGLNPLYRPTQKITVNAGDVGGPSAGLMFSLAIYDKLTPGALTGGKKIAGTGEISEDGSVGPIGGIRQKMVGARNAGADFFLAPSGDCNEVVGHIPSGLTVIKVDSFDQAKSDLEQIAGGKTSGFAACTK